MNRPRVRLPKEAAALLERPLVPVLHPWDPMRLTPGVQVAFYLQRKYQGEARLLQAWKFPNLYALPDWAMYWLSDQPFPRRAHQRWCRYYQGVLPLTSTPFGLYLFERLPLN
ncbi:MAG: hypothetical protein AAF399_08545 [Bacteroidota bacterium]